MPIEVGIIGGGFAGTAVALHLVHGLAEPVGIEIIEPREAVGFGLAYGSCRPEHRINVPADRMVVFREEPLHFADWLQRNGTIEADLEGRTTNGDFYSRRSAFGNYMESLFQDAVRNARGSGLRHRRAAAIGLESRSGGWDVRLSDGGLAQYSHLVLAATHAAPASHWPIEAGVREASGFVADPWDWQAIGALPSDADVAILGTGLTMCDVVLTLRANGHRGRIAAISRRALTPRPHAGFGSSFDLFGVDTPPKTAIGLLRLVRRRIREAQDAGDTWHSVVDALRARLAGYWPTLPVAERVKIARRLRAWWDVHRFRIAPQVDRLMSSGREEGWLSVRAGRIHRIGKAQERLILDWTPRREERRETMFDAVINCTGPDSDIARAGSPLLKSALEAGFIRPDALRVGIDVDASGRSIARDGSTNARLWAAGPLARAIVGEATGVPEASDSARNVATSLAASLAPARMT
jgi:uncharacterized NAD(P)/FAD-binding protein YdhS